MTWFDKPKLDGILSNLRRYVEALRRLASVPRDEFLADADKIASAKYHFVVAIECCIDIANHIIASEQAADTAGHRRQLRGVG